MIIFLLVMYAVSPAECVAKSGRIMHIASATQIESRLLTSVHYAACATGN